MEQIHAEGVRSLLAAQAEHTRKIAEVETLGSELSEAAQVYFDHETFQKLRRLIEIARAAL